jgi:hypothetical protein
VWDQLPDRFVLLGSLIVVAAGLAMLHRSGRHISTR